MQNLITPIAALCFLVACSSSDGQGGGTCPPGPGGAAYIYTCDSSFFGLRQCTEYYGNVPASSFQPLCEALKGKSFNGPCPVQGSIGSCSNTVTSGSDAVVSKIFEYSAAFANTYEYDCEHAGGVYESPPGMASLVTVGEAEAHTGCVPVDASSSSGSFQGFSVQLSANDKLLECTNYYGDFTDAFVSSAHGVRSPCPNDGTASGTCQLKSSNLPGATRAVEVNYGPASSNAAASCAAGGGVYSSTYTVP